jgi:DNA excision repair protein ERCC-3
LDFLKHIQTDDNLNTLFISKVGDTSIDLPDVNVIIQISSHFASRRQEAQRLGTIIAFLMRTFYIFAVGRILRPKATTSSRFNAYFYTLVSEDTKVCGVTGTLSCASDFFR